MFSVKSLKLVAGAACIIFVTLCFLYRHFVGELSVDVPTMPKRSQFPIHLPPPAECTCPGGSVILKDHIPKEQYEEVMQRRAKELQQHKARTSSVLSRLLFALPNSPLQYPIQGYIVQPLRPTLIPCMLILLQPIDQIITGQGLELCTGKRSNYKVFLNVSKGTLTTEIPAEEATVEGAGKMGLTIESSNLDLLNKLLAKVTYTSTVYHVNTADLVSFQFEEHEAMFPIVIKQPQPPVLYDMGKDINSQVTVITKTFLRYAELKVLLKSIRDFYSNITVIIADDSLKPEPITGENILHYIMPPAQGWFAGRNLAVSQVTTKYFLWVDDDFVFTKNTKIETLVEVMEAVPELDIVGGSVQGNKFHFSLHYDEGKDGGCMYRKSNGKYHSLPEYPQCSLASGVVNFFLARTDAVQRVGFDPKLKRVAHSEFFMDGLGSLMIATCGDVSIGHQPKSAKNTSYRGFRNPTRSDSELKLQLHFFKNHLKCVKYG